MNSPCKWYIIQYTEMWISIFVFICCNYNKIILFFLKVINSWLVDDIQSSSLTKIMKGVQSVEVSENMNNSHTHSSSGPFQCFWQWSKMSFSSPNTEHTLVHGIHLWHNALRRELVDIQKELCQLKFPSVSLDLNVLVVRLNFLADVLIFYW